MGWNEAVDMIFNLFEFAENLIKVLGKLIIAMPKIFSLFTIFTDPAKVIKDVLSGLTSGFMLIVNTILDSVFGFGHKKTKNTFGKLGKNNKNKKNNNVEDPKLCAKPKLLEILILVLCPPLAVFMRKGLGSILIIMLTFLLTYFYYIPGLVYASLYIL